MSSRATTGLAALAASAAILAYVGLERSDKTPPTPHGGVGSEGPADTADDKVSRSRTAPAEDEHDSTFADSPIESESVLAPSVPDEDQSRNGRRFVEGTEERRLFCATVVPSHRNTLITLAAQDWLEQAYRLLDRHGVPRTAESDLIVTNWVSAKFQYQSSLLNAAEADILAGRPTDAPKAADGQYVYFDLGARLPASLGGDLEDHRLWTVQMRIERDQHPRLVEATRLWRDAKVAMDRLTRSDGR